MTIVCHVKYPYINQHRWESVIDYDILSCDSSYALTISTVLMRDKKKCDSYKNVTKLIPWGSTNLDY